MSKVLSAFVTVTGYKRTFDSPREEAYRVAVTLTDGGICIHKLIIETIGEAKDLAARVEATGFINKDHWETGFSLYQP